MDIAYLLWLQSLREAAPAPVRGFFAFLGSDGAVMLMLVIPCVCYWCLDKRRSQLALIAYGFSMLFNQLLKNLVCCYRPWIRDARVVPEASAVEGATGYSFPSGHAQISASILGGLGWAWRERRWPLVAGVAFTLLVGFSRNFLGVHTPQDVLVGTLEGFAFVLLVERLLAWVDQGDRRDVRVVALGVVATACFLALATLKPYPLDYVDGVLVVDPKDMLFDCYKSAGSVVGVLVGWLVERRLVGFETAGLAPAQMAVRLVVGLPLVLVAYKPLGGLLVALMGSCWGQFARFLVVLLVASAGIPALFAVLPWATPAGRGGEPSAAPSEGEQR